MRSVLAISLFVLCATAHAAVVFVDFSSKTGDQGVSQTYTFSGFSVVATAYSNPSGSAGDLFGKALGGDENGVGLSTDPAGGQTEIWKSASVTTYIQLDLQDVINKLGNNVAYTIQMNSSTSGEAWNIYRTGTSLNTSPGSVFLTGTDELSHIITPQMRYLDFAVANAGNNVLLYGISFNTTPEPSSVLLMGGGLGLLALIRRRMVSGRS
jgi:hypothetical protein